MADERNRENKEREELERKHEQEKDRKKDESPSEAAGEAPIVEDTPASSGMAVKEQGAAQAGGPGSEPGETSEDREEEKKKPDAQPSDEDDDENPRRRAQGEPTSGARQGSPDQQAPATSDEHGRKIVRDLASEAFGQEGTNVSTESEAYRKAREAGFLFGEAPDPAGAPLGHGPSGVRDLYEPIPEVIERSYVKDWEKAREEANADPLAFWKARADELEWYESYDQVLDETHAPFYRWFTGGKTNVVLNALDRHVQTHRKNKLALIWEGENGEHTTMSYFRLRQEVNKFANVLSSMGVKKGDRVTIYMGRIPQIIIAMLATVKIGAVHSVVYGGFSTEALAERIEDARSRVLITADGAWIRGKTVKLKNIADEAVARSGYVEHVIVAKRTGEEVTMEPGRDYWWDDLTRLPIASPVCETEQMDSDDPLFILYTSGTTGRPKGVLHTHGGYQVHVAATLKWAFDLQDDDRWWCAADPGWITGHSYIVYGPLILGATNFLYEGAPDYPYPDRWWKLVEEYGITALYTAPTAIRGLMRFGESWPARHDISSLRILGTVGEPINPEAWRWYHRVIGKERCPIIDTWWQTETGGHMITPLPSTPLKPGSGTKPFPGIEMDVVRDDGSSCSPNEEGKLCIKRPWPGMLRTVYGDPDRYIKQYWSEFGDRGWYLTGDSARKDEDGYIWIIGRLDDVIKVAGYRLGTAEIESALVSHPSVSEAAVIGVPDEVKGNVIHAFCIPSAGAKKPTEQDLKQHVRTEMGPIAVPAKIELVDKLPKTRSGKIMRRVLRAKAMGEPVGDLSTMED